MTASRAFTSMRCCSITACVLENDPLQSDMEFDHDSMIVVSTSSNMPCMSVLSDANEGCELLHNACLQPAAETQHR